MANKTFTDHAYAQDLYLSLQGDIGQARDKFVTIAPDSYYVKYVDPPEFVSTMPHADFVIFALLILEAEEE